MKPQAEKPNKPVKSPPNKEAEQGDSLKPIYYLNGETSIGDPPAVSVDDRGFVFGDGIYEVIRVYSGKPFCLEQHLDRFYRSAGAVNLRVDSEHDRFSRSALKETITGLIDQGGFKDASVYLQLTRGRAPRNHAFPPDGTPPTLFITVKSVSRKSPSFLQTGVSCITVEDLRWFRCDVKTLNLLYNVMVRNKAIECGCHDAILYRVFPTMSSRSLPQIDVAPTPMSQSRPNEAWGNVFKSPGRIPLRCYTEVTESSSANLFAVIDGKLVTHPADNLILGGVTREVIVDICKKKDIGVCERPFGLIELQKATEVFLTGTVLEIAPVVNIDGRPVGDGRPGPMTLEIAQHYIATYENECCV